MPHPAEFANSLVKIDVKIGHIVQKPAHFRTFRRQACKEAAWADHPVGHIQTHQRDIAPMRST
jgi:hypothetical protein